MRLVKASYDIYAASFNKNLPYSYDDSKLLIEVAGRTCYKSEEKIAEGTAEKFVAMLRSRGHCAMIEHSWSLREYTQNVPYYKFLNYMQIDGNSVLVAGNDRAFEEWNFEIKNVCYSPSDKVIDQIYKEKRWDMLSATVKVVTDRGVSHEIVRHRPPAYAQESTRYCNYSNSKFGNHLTFIIPPWIDLQEGDYSFEDDSISSKILYKEHPDIFKWLKSLNYEEHAYFEFINDHNWIPGRARCVLPNSLKTEIVITADLAEWQHIFKLRTAPDAHEQMREIMIPLQEDFKKLMPEVFGS